MSGSSSAVNFSKIIGTDDLLCIEGLDFATECDVLLSHHRNLSDSDKAAFNNAVGKLHLLMVPLAEKSITKELNECQIEVRQLINQAFGFLGPALLHGQELVADKGSRISANLNSGQYSVDTPLVFCPISICPDVVVKLKEAPDQVAATFAEVKLDADMKSIYGNALSSLHPIKQAALYAIVQLLRVFPHLPPQEVDELFGQGIDRAVFIPLLSHKTLVMIKISYPEIVSSGGFTCHYFGPYQNEQYAEVLCKWFLYSSRVIQKLQVNRDKLKNGPSFCWVPQEMFMADSILNELKIYGDDSLSLFQGLQARPSYFNPIYHNQDYYFRIGKCLWCGNGSTQCFQKKRLVKMLESRHWRFADGLQIVPNYGDCIARCPPLNHAELKMALVGLCDELIELELLEVVHMDLRLENVCWNPLSGTAADVKLIDFDYVVSCGKILDPKNVTLYQPPDINANEKTDMWSVGINFVRILYNVKMSEEEQYGALFKFVDTLRLSCKPQSEKLSAFNISDKMSSILCANGLLKLDRRFDLDEDQVAQVLCCCMQPVKFRYTASEFKTVIENILQ